MLGVFRPTFSTVLAAALAAALSSLTAVADEAEVARGEYLVTIGGCNDCHTPGYFFGKPGMSRFLGGSDVGFEIPGLGVFVGPNITPDPDGRALAPIMPWHAFAHLTENDASAIRAFLQSLEPVSKKVPGPFAPGEKVSSFMFRIMPPGETAAAAPK